MTLCFGQNENQAGCIQNFSESGQTWGDSPRAPYLSYNFGQTNTLMFY